MMPTPIIEKGRDPTSIAVLLAPIANDPRGHPDHRGVRRNIFRHDGTCPDQGALANGDPAKDRRVRADRRSAPNASALELPVRGPLHCARIGRGAWVSVIGEHHAVPDKHLIFNGNTLADECVRRNFATFADLDTALNFHKCTDARVGADRTSIKVNEIRVRNSYAIFEENILV
jgi:hypothetical protein